MIDERKGMVADVLQFRTEDQQAASNIVEALEGALASARQGQVAGVVLGLVLRDGRTITSATCGTSTTPDALVGCAERVKHRILNEWR